MQLTSKEIKTLKTKLALAGTGSKGRLADELNLFGSQITLMCESGYVPEHASKKLKKYISE